MQSKSTKILIIDDHQLFADGLEMLLMQLPHEVELSKRSNAQKVLESPDEWKHVDLILIDLHMPDLSGFAFLQALSEQPSPPPVAVISGVELRAEIERALSLGAAGFIPKDSAGSEMLFGVNKVLKGERYLPPQWVGKIDWPTQGNAAPAKPRRDEPIGPRQLEVLKLLQDGLQNKQIALVLGVSVSTVKSHTQLLYRSLSVTNRTAAIKAASELGLL